MPSPVVQTLSHDRRMAEALLEISYAVGSVMVIDDILQRICEIGARVMETDTCSVYLLDEENPGWLRLAATKGLSRAEELGVRGFNLGAGIPGWAAKNNQTVALADSRSDQRDAQLDDTIAEKRFIAFLCTPLRIQDDVVGVMSLRRARAQEWKPEEIIFAEIVAKQIAIVLEKARLYNEKIGAERLAAIAISLSEVAHYIKNILAGMSGGSYFVDSGLKRGDLEKVRGGWDLLKRNTEKIRNLVENMLLFSREQACELVEGDMHELIVDLAAEIEETAIQRHVQIRLELARRMPPLAFDSGAFHDVLLNMISNAMDAVGEEGGGVITLRTELDEKARAARIHVQDNGSGIPTDVHDKIFNLFFTTKGRKGTGIGLAVTKKMVEEHHGRLSFVSEPGAGTTFTIELPLPGSV